MTSLSKGGELTPESFADFVSRLKYHSEGEGVHDHCTADAIFLVQKKVIVTGIDLEYDPARCIIDTDDGTMWTSPAEFYDANAAYYSDNIEYHVWPVIKPFCDLNEKQQWESLINFCSDSDNPFILTGYKEKWEYVNSHFTQEAALAFIDRKGHDYPDGLRVYVDAQTYCWEWNTIKQALMDGRLVLKED